MQLFYQPRIPDGVHYLDDTESKHAVKVLRLTQGDEIRLTDGKGKFYTAIISTISGSICHFNISETQSVPKKDYSIHIGIAPTKNMDRMEWFIEKATEVGIDEISFIQCQNSERKVVNLERLQKKVVSAMKQSRQAWLPALHSLRPFKDALTNDGIKCIAWINTSGSVQLKELPTHSKYYILIGPEGDFTKEEIDLAASHEFKAVSLGQNILRTETAGVVACHTLNLINQ